MTTAPRWTRALYVIEFTLAVPACIFLWEHAGGQSHLDLMGWHWKLAAPLAAAFAVTRATRHAVTHDTAWNPRTLRWIGVLLAIAMMAGAVTYYHHVYEPVEDVMEEEEPAT